MKDDVNKLCRTDREMLRLAFHLRGRNGIKPPVGNSGLLYHVTNREMAPIIMADGFKNMRAAKGVPGFGTTFEFDPGVWLADIPPVTTISLDQFMGHEDEAWIEVLVDAAFYKHHMKGNEWQDESWPTRQWLVSAEAVNKLPRRIVGLAEVMMLRLANGATERCAYHTRSIILDCIKNETSGVVQERWLSALEVAEAEIGHLSASDIIQTLGDNEAHKERVSALYAAMRCTEGH